MAKIQKRKKLTQWIVGFCFFSLGANKIFAEPSYCNPEEFRKKEIKNQFDQETKNTKLKNARLFQLGQVFLLGVGIGDSDTETLIQFAKKHSINAEKSKYCTWYLNHPKENTPYDQKNRIEAIKVFIHKDIVRSPSTLKDDEAVLEFWKTLERTFDVESISFLSCATDHHYVALGCNGMAHRGPTAFGMLLAFSGCTPEHSLKIVSQLWESEGLKDKVRLAAMRKAYELGMSHIESQKKLAKAFSDEKASSSFGR